MPAMYLATLGLRDAAGRAPDKPVPSESRAAGAQTGVPHTRVDNSRSRWRPRVGAEASPQAAATILARAAADV